MTQPVYDTGRFPKQLVPKHCRGCHQPVPKGRHSWCGDECFNKFHPVMVRRAVDLRDKKVCQLCGLDVPVALKAWKLSRPPFKFGDETWQAWRRSKPKVEYDHTVPFAEGGLTVLTNMRTLCVPCHRKVTKEFAAKRAAARKAAKASGASCEASTPAAPAS